MRLLSERPEARGLAVPGMPTGSPGIEMPEVSPDSYEVILFDDKLKSGFLALLKRRFLTCKHLRPTPRLRRLSESILYQRKLVLQQLPYYSRQHFCCRLDTKQPSGRTEQKNV